MNGRCAGSTLDLLCAGLSFIDVNLAGLPQTGPVLGQELWTECYGVGPGGVANFALAAARLGAHVGLASVVGEDAMGRLFVSECEQVGIDCSHCVSVSGWSQPVTAALTWAGDRALVTGGCPPPVSLADHLVAHAPAARAVIAHVDADSRRWLEPLVRDGAKLVAQVGWDPSSAWDLDRLDVLDQSWAFLPNEAEALAYTRTDDVRAAARALAERVPVVVITRGGAGSHCLDATTGDEFDAAPLEVELVDATGAGDMFGAAFAVAIARGCAARDAVELATAVAGLGVARPGGASAAPTLAEALHALARRGTHPAVLENLRDALDPREDVHRHDHQGDQPCP